MVVRAHPPVSSQDEISPCNRSDTRCCGPHRRPVASADTSSATDRLVGAGRYIHRMRIALDSAVEVGARAGRILLAEDSLSYLGLMRPSQRHSEPRTGPVGDLSTYDVIVSDGATPASSLIASAAVHGVPLVLWSDEPTLHRGSAVAPVAVGANLGSTLAPALIHHPAMAIEKDDAVTIAWTEPGPERRKGKAIVFPDPLGVCWARKRSRGRFVSYRDDEWAGAVVSVSGRSGDRIVGVADHASHLEAITLAAVALTALDGAYDARIQNAADRGEGILSRAMSLELDIAVWRSGEHSTG